MFINAKILWFRSLNLFTQIEICSSASEDVQPIVKLTLKSATGRSLL